MKKYIFLLILCFLFIPSNVLAEQVDIVTETNKTFVVELESSDTIEAVKEKIEDKEGIATADQRLKYNGLILEDGRTLADYNIVPDKTVNYTIALEVKHEITILKSENGEIKSSVTRSFQGEDIELEISPAEGYKLSELLVYNSGDKNEKVDVKNNYFIMPIYDVTVSGTFVSEAYEVIYELSNLTSNGPVSILPSQDYSAILVADHGYNLPDAVSIKLGDTLLSIDDYTYDKYTGKLLIPSSVINDKIIISAEGLSVKSENLAQIKNPQTSDNIIKYFIIGILSLVILAFIVVYFRKKTKVN